MNNVVALQKTESKWDQLLNAKQTAISECEQRIQQKQQETAELNRMRDAINARLSVLGSEVWADRQLLGQLTR